MTVPLTISDAFEVHGTWWLPADPSDRVAGKLKFEPGTHPELEVSQPFRSLDGSALLSLGRISASVPAIIGRSDDGTPWTAFDAVPVSFGLEGSSPVTYIPRYCLEAYQPDSGGPPVFSELVLRTSHLAEWVGRWPKQKVTMPNIRVSYSTASKAILKARIKTPGTTVLLESWVSPAYRPVEMRIRSYAQWRFQPKTPINFETALVFARMCRDFLTLAVNEPVDITRICGRCRRLSPKAPSARHLTNSEWVAADIITELHTSKHTTTSNRMEPRLAFSDLPNPGAAVSNWFDLYPDLEEVIGLILGAQYVGGYLSTEFLNLTQALEAFHRRAFNGTYFPETVYSQIRQRLVDAIPANVPNDENGARLKERLSSLYQFANEVSFRSRLKELCSKLAPPTLNRLKIQLKPFVDQIVKTRNYLTHLDTTSRIGTLVSDPQNLRPLWQANMKLNAIATIHLLKSIGVPEENAGRGISTVALLASDWQSKSAN